MVQYQTLTLYDQHRTKQKQAWYISINISSCFGSSLIQHPSRYPKKNILGSNWEFQQGWLASGHYHNTDIKEICGQLKSIRWPLQGWPKPVSLALQTYSISQDALLHPVVQTWPIWEFGYKQGECDVEMCYKPYTLLDPCSQKCSPLVKLCGPVAVDQSVY